MFKKLLVFLFICMVLVANCADITIKSITTTPSTNPTAVSNGNNENTCTGITVSVEFSSAPVSGAKVAVSLASHAGDIISIKKITETNYEVSGITLAEDTSITNFKITIDGTEIALDENVVTPTIKCLSASSSASSSDSASSTTVTDIPPKIQTFTIETESAVATNQGQLYCKGVKVDFTLDKVVSTDLVKPTYSKLPALGTAKTNLPDTKVPTYYFELDVAVGGTLDDLTVTYNNVDTLSHPAVKFICNSPPNTDTPAPTPTTPTPTTPTPTNENDGSFASTISINSLLIFTISSILLLKQF